MRFALVKERGYSMDTQADQLIEAAKQLSLDELKTVSQHILEMFHDRKWEELLAQPVLPGTAMWEIEQRAKADIRAGRVKEWESGESFEALFQ